MRPMYAAIDAALSVAPWLRPSVEKLAWRIFYELVSLRSDEHTTMLAGGGFNYGFAGSDEITAGEGDTQFGLALYAAVALSAPPRSPRLDVRDRRCRKPAVSRRELRCRDQTSSHPTATRIWRGFSVRSTAC